MPAPRAKHRRPLHTAARVAAVSLGLAALGAIAVAQDPYRLVRAEFAHQRVLAGLSKAQVEVGDHRWVYAYNDDAPADAPTIVMLHGFTGSKQNWYLLAQRLRGRYRLLIPDLPGWSESERKPEGDYGYSAQSERVAAFVHAVSPGKPVTLLGHSMGGGIAALTAARHPDIAARVGLFNASGVRFGDNRFGRQVLAGGNPFAVTDAASLQHYLGILFDDDRARPHVPWPASVGLIRHRREEGAFEQSVLDRIGRGAERFLPGDEATQIRRPALLLWCRQDAVIDPSALALYAARIPQASRVLIDGCGHMSIMERPDAVAEAVVALQARERVIGESQTQARQ